MNNNYFSYLAIDWSLNTAPVYLFGVPVDISFAANKHGVIKIGTDVGTFLAILFTCLFSILFLLVCRKLN